MCQLLATMEVVAEGLALPEAVPRFLEPVAMVAMEHLPIQLGQLQLPLVTAVLMLAVVVVLALGLVALGEPEEAETARRSVVVQPVA
jgi:hypothetical protein